MPVHFTPSARIRRSPFFSSTVADGVTSFSVYNHMYMPTGFGHPMDEYWRLIEGVAMWDVACERQVEIAGEDAGRLAQILCPRKLEDLKTGQGWYVPVCDHNGLLLNDPILLKLAQDRYWLSIADGDLLLWVKAVAAERSLDVSVSEPDASPLAVQGPKAIEVIVDLFGDQVRSMGYFRFRQAKLDGIPLLLARSGYSKQGGFELYLRDASRGAELWNKVKEAGALYDIGPGSPSGIERVESGLLSFGGDTDAQTNPFEVRMGQYIDLDAPDDTIGIRALRAIHASGPKRHQLGVILHDAPGTKIPLYDVRSRIFRSDTPVGQMTINTWSPRLERNIGICMLLSRIVPGDAVQVELPNGKTIEGEICELPFL